MSLSGFVENFIHIQITTLKGLPIMKIKKLSMLILFLISLSGQSALAYESFSHTTLLLPHEPQNSEPWVKVMTTQEEWESFFNSTLSVATYPVGEAPEAPVLDFENYQVISGGLGAKPSSGYSLAVEKVIETDHEMYINLISMSPSSDCAYLTVITYPTVTILVKKSTKELKYTITPAVSGCE